MHAILLKLQQKSTYCFRCGVDPCHTSYASENGSSNTKANRSEQNGKTLAKIWTQEKLIQIQQKIHTTSLHTAFVSASFDAVFFSWSYGRITWYDPSFGEQQRCVHAALSSTLNDQSCWWAIQRERKYHQGQEGRQSRCRYNRGFERRWRCGRCCESSGRWCARQASMLIMPRPLTPPPTHTLIPQRFLPRVFLAHAHVACGIMHKHVPIDTD